MTKRKKILKLLPMVIRLLVCVGIFFATLALSGNIYFNEHPLFEIPNLAELLIGGLIGVPLFIYFPVITGSFRIWFENLFEKIIKRVVSDFLKMQSDRLKEAKKKNEAKKEKGLAADIKKHGGSPVVVDTSAIIDGRILDVIKLGFLDSLIIISDGVIQELRHIADSKESIKRQRGRRGLDILNDIKKLKGKNFKSVKMDSTVEVDKDLINIAKKYKGRLATVDYNLNKAAKVSGVKVMNVNELVNCLKTVVLPGEELEIKIMQEGKDPKQGVGYLEDGTMVVVEDGHGYIKKGKTKVTVHRVIQTSAGKMIFCKISS